MKIGPDSESSFSVAGRIRGTTRALVLLLCTATALTVCSSDGESQRFGDGMEQVSVERQEGPMGPCSAREIDEVLAHLQAVMEAYAALDVMRIIDVWLNLEQRVSPDCWLAANRHVHPQVVNACTAEELDQAASYAGPMLRATRSFLQYGNMTSLMDVSMRAMSGLSPGCMYAMQAVQQAAQTQPGSISGTLPSVYDHGGGTYSVPGMGSCGPSGCIPF